MSLHIYCVLFCYSGDLKMCQTTVICEYLGQQFGLYPDTDTNVWRARQINQTIHDFTKDDTQNTLHRWGSAQRVA